MEILLDLIILQGVMGAFDVLYHHELTERLPWRVTAGKELKLHGIRNFFYVIVYLSLGWLAWHGVWAWLFAAILIVEVLITLWDFVEEDRSRQLPPSERVTHTLLALNYGAVLAFFVPVWLDWLVQPSGFSIQQHGWLSWVMSFFALGVFVWGMRDMLRGMMLARQTKKSWARAPLLARPDQRILVAGGTGFIGVPLCQLLIDQGHQVTVLTRSMAGAAKKFHGKIALVESADLLDEAEGFDAIINLVGEPVAQRWTQRARQRIMASRPDSIIALMRYLARAKQKPSVFIQASAIGVYGLSESRIFDESTPLHAQPESYCEEICFAVERAAEPIAAMGIRLCLLRIGLVLEKDGGILAQLLFPHEFGLAGPVGSGKQWMSWIHRDDAIGLIYHAINTAEVVGAMNLTAPEPVQQRSFARAIGKAMRRPAFMPLPACVVKVLFGEMGREILLSGQHVLPVKAQATGYRFYYATLQTALSAILK